MLRGDIRQDGFHLRALWLDKGIAWVKEAVLGEESLSFLGAGTPPYIPGWGKMLGEARVYLREPPWTMRFPGLALASTGLALNLLGDGIRDVLDLHLRTV
jgi:peptide/nickel transport system permease protein